MWFGQDLPCVCVACLLFRFVAVINFYFWGFFLKLVASLNIKVSICIDLLLALKMLKFILSQSVFLPTYTALA